MLRLSPNKGPGGVIAMTTRDQAPVSCLHNDYMTAYQAAMDTQAA